MVANDIQQLIPARSDRVFIAGQTGSGKTTLARVLLQQRKYVVILDSKGTIKWPGYTRVESFRKLTELEPEAHPKIVYHPTYWEEKNGTMDAFFRWVYDRRNCTLYVDELMGCTRGDDYPDYYGACLTRGRELKIEVWSGTQRPKNIPQVSMSEAEHAFIFRLRMPQDRVRVQEVAGIDARLIGQLRKRDFLYAPQEGEVIGPQTLILTTAEKSATR
jgi:energy-coupling factor transporter ATP-binding protein EcfA2